MSAAEFMLQSRYGTSSFGLEQIEDVVVDSFGFDDEFGDLDDDSEEFGGGIHFSRKGKMKYLAVKCVELKLSLRSLSIADARGHSTVEKKRKGIASLFDKSKTVDTSKQLSKVKADYEKALHDWKELAAKEGIRDLPFQWLQKNYSSDKKISALLDRLGDPKVIRRPKTT